MANNFRQIGEVMDYTNTTGATIKSGDVVLVGKRVGVALGDIADQKVGSVQMEGVFDLPKKPADAPAQGALVYWSAPLGKITTTATRNMLAGYAFLTASGGDKTVAVKLNG